MNKSKVDDQIIEPGIECHCVGRWSRPGKEEAAFAVKAAKLNLVRAGKWLLIAAIEYRRHLSVRRIQIVEKMSRCLLVLSRRTKPIAAHDYGSLLSSLSSPNS